MERRILFTILSTLMVASLALAACGGAAAPPTVAPTAPPATAPPATEPSAEEPTAAAQECPPPVDVSAMEMPANPKTVTGGWTQEPNNINPYYTVMSYANWITQLTLAGLGEWDESGNLVPELATEVPSAENGGVSADGLTITWHLKPCLYWSDGEPITANDVVFTYNSIVDPGNVVTQTTGYTEIESATALDDLTVQIVFKKLFPAWPILFTQGPNNSGSILPAHILEGQTGLENNPEIHQPTVFSGPFMITEWVAGDHMTLAANPNFFKGHAVLDQIQIKFIPDPETALAALQTGDIDWYPDFSESDISTVGALEPAVHLLVVPGADFEHYFFNMGTTAGVNGTGISDYDGFCPFRDERVRQAIVLGIDRQAIVETLLEGETTVPGHQWPNSYWDSGLQPDAYDPVAAGALLDEAGYTDANGDGVREGTCDGTVTPLSFNFQTTTKQLRVDIATIAQQNLAEIGVEMKPEFLPAGTFFGTYSEGGPLYAPAAGGGPGYDLAGYTTGFYPDPYTDDLLCNNIPNAANGGAGDNAYHLCDPELDAMFAQMNESADPAARKAVLAEIQQYIHDHAYVVMMYARANVYGYVDRMIPGPFGFFSNMNWNAEVWDVK